MRYQEEEIPEYKNIRVGPQKIKEQGAFAQELTNSLGKRSKVH